MSQNIGQRGADELGSVERYPVLYKLFKDINILNSKQKKKIISHLSKVNHVAKYEMPKASTYVADLILKDFRDRLYMICYAHSIPEDVLTRADCYTKAVFMENFTNNNYYEQRNKA